MNHAEKFALDEHLSDYPNDATYDEVCDMILDEDERVSVWMPFESTPPTQIVENIDCTLKHFDAVVRDLLTNQGESK